MQYIDPLDTVCDQCGSRSSHRVTTLLQLQAICPDCGNALVATGSRMRRDLDDWGRFMNLCRLTVGLEEALNISIADTEIADVQTLRDLVQVVERRVSESDLTPSKAWELVEQNFWNIPWQSAGTVNWDAPIVDAISPDRWTKPLN